MQEGHRPGDRPEAWQGRELLAPGLVNDDRPSVAAGEFDLGPRPDPTGQGHHGVRTEDVDVVPTVGLQLPRREVGRDREFDVPVRVARQEMIAKEGERLVVTAGVPFGTPGATNILRIAYV